jgi:hypothetical protein
MKIITLTIVLIIGLTNFIKAQDNLDFSLQLNKTSYLMGEPVEVSICIKNYSDSLFTFNGRCGFLINMMDINGNPLNLKVTHLNEWILSQNKLEPHEELCRIVELNDLYGISYDGFTRYSYFSPGEYKIWIKFFEEETTKFEKEVVINITVPAGEEYNVHINFKDAIEKYSTEGNVFESQLLNLRDKNPNSFYAPKILTILQAIYAVVLQQPVKAYEIERKLIEDYTSSGQVFYFLRGYIENNVAKSSRNNFLTNLKTKSSGSIMEKHIELLIKKY